MKTIASILVLNIVAVLSMDTVCCQVTLCSVENCSFFDTEYANTSKNILLSNELLSNHASKLDNCQSKIALYFINTVENIPHSTKIIIS